MTEDVHDDTATADVASRTELWEGAARVRRLLEARCVAIFGANDRHRHTRMVLEGLSGVGFPDRDIYLLNERFDTVAGRKCHPNARSLDLHDGLAVVVSAARHALPAIEDAAAAGCRCAIVIAEGFAGRGEAGQELQTSLRETAHRLDVTLLGPNTLGFVAPGRGISAWSGDGVRRPLERGPISLLFQSSGMLNVVLSVAAHWRMGVQVALSVGNEGDIDLTDALEFALVDEDTRVVGVYCEGIRNPRQAAQILAALNRVGKTVVMMSAGRSDRARRNALAHAGRLATGGRTWEALCRKLGVILVSDLDEFMETIYLAQYGPSYSGGRTGLVTVSGGDVALLSDLAADIGLELPLPGEELRTKLAAEVGAPDVVGNPLDSGALDTSTTVRAAGLLCTDDQLGLVAFRCRQPQTPDAISTELYTRLVGVARQHGKLPVLLSRTIEPLDEKWFEFARDLGVPLLMSYRPALHAIRNFVTWHTSRHRRAGEKVDLGGLPDKVLPVADGVMLDLSQAVRIVSKLGIAYVASRYCRTVSAAVEAAEELGFPVAVKGVSPDTAHKSRVGGVRLDVADAAAVRRGCEDIVTALTQAGLPLQGFELQRMVPEGPQLILGVSRDQYCGRVMLAGRGGVDVEYGTPPLVLIPPLSEHEVRDAADELISRGLLAGMPATDEVRLTDLLRQVLSTFSTRLATLPSEVSQVDLNPVILAEPSPVAVDVVVVRDK